MSFPKMIYRSSGKVKDQKSLEAGLASGTVQTLVVGSAEQEAAALDDGWTEDLASLIGSTAKKAKAE